MTHRTIIEPFRIKAVEPIRMTTREERTGLIEAAHYNLFALKSPREQGIPKPPEGLAQPAKGEKVIYCRH